MTEAERIQQLDAQCRALSQHRQRPLLVLYYPIPGHMHQSDARDVYAELRGAGLTKEQRAPAIDALLHTEGGDPTAGYRLAQVIRSLCDDLVVLVPEYAYSAGTLLTFAGSQVRLGDFAGLSPIDIALTEPDSRQGGEVELANVDYFMDFAGQAREKIEGILARTENKCATSNVESELLVQMVKDVGALRVGKYFRERMLTGFYAEILLDHYMFRSAPDRRDRRNTVIQQFLREAPSHDFHLDYKLCKERKLEVEQMPTAESDLAKTVIGALEGLTDSGIVCQRVSRRYRMPFFRYYQLAPASQGGASNASTTSA